MLLYCWGLCALLLSFSVAVSISALLKRFVSDILAACLIPRTKCSCFSVDEVSAVNIVLTIVDGDNYLDLQCLRHTLDTFPVGRHTPHPLVLQIHRTSARAACRSPPTFESIHCPMIADRFFLPPHRTSAKTAWRWWRRRSTHRTLSCAATSLSPCSCWLRFTPTCRPCLRVQPRRVWP